MCEINLFIRNRFLDISFNVIPLIHNPELFEDFIYKKYEYIYHFLILYEFQIFIKSSLFMTVTYRCH
jgi:hypothetical protein